VRTELQTNAIRVEENTPGWTMISLVRVHHRVTHTEGIETCHISEIPRRWSRIPIVVLVVTSPHDPDLTSYEVLRSHTAKINFVKTSPRVQH